jgi:hypothetical protein
VNFYKRKQKSGNNTLGLVKKSNQQYLYLFNKDFSKDYDKKYLKSKTTENFFE